MATQPVDPLNHLSNLTTKDPPSPFFIRQWQNLITLVFTVQDAVSDILGILATVITPGTGLTGGGNISSGNISISLGNTTVTAGSYGNATTVGNFTVNAQGQLTAAGNTTINITESNLTLGNVTTDNVTTARHGFVPILPNDATKFFDGTGNYTSPSTGVGGVAALTNTHIFVGNATNVATDVAVSGDVTVTNTGVVTIANDAVTYAKIQNVTDARLLGRAAGSSGDAQEITVGASLTLSSGQLALSGSGSSADYSAAVLADTPTAYWKCDEASGTLVDSSGGGYNLTTAAGTLVYQHSPLLAGESTAYLKLNSTTAQMKSTTGLGLSFPLSGDWTAEAIMRAESSSLTAVGLITLFSIDGGASETEANNCQAQFGVAASSGLNVRWENGTGTDVNVVSGILAPLSNKPAHVVAVKDGTANTITFYVNGRLQDVAVSYASETTGGSGTMVTYIGANAEISTGKTVVGHIAFYPTKLSAARIFAHAYAAGLTGA